MASELLQHLKMPQSPARKLGDHEQRDVHIFCIVFHILVSYEQVRALPDHSQAEVHFQAASTLFLKMEWYLSTPVLSQKRKMCLKF